MKFDAQTIKELEFDKLCEQLASHCKSQRAKEIARKLNAFGHFSELKDEFKLLNEVVIIHSSNNSLPHPGSGDIDHALKTLRVENGVLTVNEVLQVLQLCLETQRLIKFSREHKSVYPYIYNACEHIQDVDRIVAMVLEIIDIKLQDVKNDATPTLFSIRTKLKTNQTEINHKFDRALKKYKKLDFLGVQEETFLENRRLLTVLSTYKKQVEGKIWDVSAKQTLSYIEPQTVMQLNSEQDRLRISERNEVYHILEKLTLQLRSEQYFLKAYQRLLVRFDILNAKVKFSKFYEGIIPKIAETKAFEWHEAKHPLLLMQNNNQKLPTFGQDIYLHPESRFLVISGPNAGGKSITLKTVGLLQLMFQSAFLLPISHGSTCCWFDEVFSDIGDNQSIENQLSTYSYRLKRMRFFLEKSTENTLLLLDEFGSGSDPELGGALAEVFYEELYRKKLYAVITTHYNNIKILTSQLSEAKNACMLFDTKKLTPQFKLSIGQPGSSFTFEVAQFNGIEKALLEKAKSKVSDNKLKIDELAVHLQREKSRLKKESEAHKKERLESSKILKEYRSKLSDFQIKSKQQQAYFEQQTRYLNIGKKILEILNKYKHHKTTRKMDADIQKYTAILKSKIKEKKNPVELKKSLTPPELNKLEKTEVVKNTVNTTEIKKESPPQKEVKVGDHVKIKGQTAKGIVREIKGKKVVLHIDNLVINTTLKELDL